MATKEQIAANRKNARKSTGPKSPAGKDQVKFNGLRHGLRAEAVVLPSEDDNEFKAFVDAWMDDWRPTTMARAQLVKEAAVAAWRKERCVRAEATRLGRRIRETVGGWRTQEQRKVDEAVAALPDDPRGAVERLLATRAGVERMIALWAEIAGAATPDGWDDAHHFRVIFLCGRMPADDEAIGLRDDSWRLYLRNAPADMIADDDPEPWGDAEALEVAAGLRDLAAGRIAELRADRDRLADPLPSWLAQAEAETLLPREEDALLLRYESQRSREFHRALGDLTKMAQSGSDLVAVAIEEAEEDVPAEAGTERIPSTPCEPGTSEELASVGNSSSSSTEARPQTSPMPTIEPAPRAAEADLGAGLALRCA
ncbi:MAG TPA: hypothetical protein VGH33_10210 [Isosphaeraceae bacterium]